MYGILLIIAVFIIIILIIGLHQKKIHRDCHSRRRLEGKTIIVTGGTAGMGLEMATDLAHRGARVIVACPFEGEGTNAKKQIVQETENPNVVFKLLDLGSLKSIRKFAEDILKTEDRLDILINNAGVGIPRESLTADGMHFIMQVNYYGTFLLTLLLLPLLKKTGTPGEPSRILLTTSNMYIIGQVDVDKLNKINYWYRYQPYANSKLCLIHFANEMSRRLKGTNVVINNVNPGAVGTNIYYSINFIYGFLSKVVLCMLFKTPREGAQTALHVALDKKAGEVSGAYFYNCEISRVMLKGYCVKIDKILWEHSVRLVQLTDKELEQCFK